MLGQPPEPSWAGDAHEMIVVGFSHSRISPTVYTTPGIQDTTRIAPLQEQPHKRRRLQIPKPGPVNINTRFDRMLARVNAVSLAPRDTWSPLRRRKRGRSVSSTSGSSEKAPPTPVDAYDALEGGRLGDGFTVFKPRGRQEDVEEPFINSSRSRSPLPSWLAQTFATLESHNPLRRLAASSDANEFADDSGNNKTICRNGSSDSQLEHRVGDQLVETLAQDSVFAFSPPPQLDSLMPTNPSHSISNHASPKQSSFASRFDASGELKASNTGRGTESPFPSKHLNSLLEISPTSRPFGTPGPSFYPKTPVSASPLTNYTAGAPPSFFVPSRKHSPSHLTCQNFSEKEVTRRSDDPTADLRLDYALATFNASYDALSHSRLTANDDGYISRRDDTRDLNANRRLALPDTAEVPCNPPLGLGRLCLESPTEPPEADICFRFARVAHAAARPATEGLKSSFAGAMQADIVTGSSSPRHIKGTLKSPLCALPLISGDSKSCSEESRIGSVRLGTSVRNGDSEKLAYPLSIAAANSLTQGDAGSLFARDVSSSELFAHTGHLPHLSLGTPSRGLPSGQGGSARSPLPDQDVAHPQMNHITNQVFLSTCLDTTVSQSAPYYEANIHTSKSTAEVNVSEAVNPSPDHVRGQWRQTEDTTRESARATNEDEQCHQESDAVTDRNTREPDFIAHVAVNLPSPPHIPMKRPSVTATDPAVSDDSRLALPNGTDMKQLIPLLACVPAYESFTPELRRAFTPAPQTEEEGDAIYWSQFSDDSIMHWGDFEETSVLKTQYCRGHS